MRSIHETQDNIDKTAQVDQYESVVSSSAEPKNSRKRLRVGAGILLVVVLVVLGLWLLQKHNTHSGLAETPQQMAIDGNYKGALKIFQQQVDDAKTPTAKAQVYQQIVQTAIGVGQVDDALEYAQKANAVLPTASNSAQVGFQAANVGNWQLAAKSFSDAVAMSPKPSDGDQRADYFYYLAQEKDAEAHL